jgi:hypothetical protein
MITVNAEELKFPSMMAIATDILKNELLVSLQLIPHHSILYKAQEIVVNFYEKWNASGKKMNFIATYMIIAIEGITEEIKNEFITGIKEKMASMKDIAPAIIEIAFLDLERGRKGINLNLEDPKDQWLKFLFDPTFFQNMSADELEKYPLIKEALKNKNAPDITEEDILEFAKFKEWADSFKSK